MSRKRKNTGIYCYKNLVNGKVYVGQAYNMERRLYEHEYHLARGTDKAVALQHAVSKYGRENFEVVILENCEPEEMNDREIYWIEKFQSANKEYGYNISVGGNSGLIGYRHSPEVGMKISLANKGRKMSEEQKQVLSNIARGKPKSAETRRRMSENHSRFWLGKKMPPEVIEKLKIAHGGENAYQFGKKTENAKSQYRGVYRSVQKGHVYWMAQVSYMGKKTYLGMRKDELEAALLYDAYVREHNLPNPLNFPD